MLMVVKRSGKEEPFDLEKIKITLGSASDELGEPLSQGGIKLITEPLLRDMEGRERIASKEILDMLIKTMKELGYKDLADSYSSRSSF